MDMGQVEQTGLDPKAKAEKRIGQKEQILAMLERAGDAGVDSETLNRVAFRYSALIFRLRADGFVIDTLPRKNTELARFVLRGKSAGLVQTELF